MATINLPRNTDVTSHINCDVDAPEKSEPTRGVVINTLKTTFQTEVYLCPETSRLAHGRSEEPQFRETLLVRFKNLPNFALLSRRKLLRRSCDRPPTERPIQFNYFPVFIRGAADADSILLHDFESRRGYLCRIGSEYLVLDKATALNATPFFLASVEYAMLPPDVIQCVSLWSDLVASRGDASRFLTLIEAFPTDMMLDVLKIAIDLIDAQARPEFLSNLLAMELPSHDGHAARRPKFYDLLSFAPWLQDAFTQLCAWSRDRNVSMPRYAGAALDLLGADRTWTPLAPTMTGLRVLSKFKETIVPRRKLAIVACARDEGLYLLEWIAVHRVMGVEGFFIYTNDLTDGSDKVLQRLHDAGIIHWIDNTGDGAAGINLQTKAYAHSLLMLPALLDYEWCLTVDLDEWFLPAATFNHDLTQLLASFGAETDAIVATWRINGPEQALCWSDALSCDRTITLTQHPLVKTIFRPHHFYRAAPHVPIAFKERHFKTVDGAEHRFDLADVEAASFSEAPTVRAEIHHFNMRSFEEFIWRYARGEADGNAVLREKRFRYNDPGIFALFTSNFRKTGPQLASVMSTQCQNEVERLMALPGVREAWNNVRDQFFADVPRYVQQSLDAVTADPNVAEDVKREWRALVTAWRATRDSALPTHSKDEADVTTVI